MITAEYLLLYFPTVLRTLTQALGPDTWGEGLMTGRTAWIKLLLNIEFKVMFFMYQCNKMSVKESSLPLVKGDKGTPEEIIEGFP